MTITIDRVMGWPNQSAATYSYVLPAAVKITTASPTGNQVVVVPSDLIGKTIRIHTDGQVITDGGAG